MLNDKRHGLLELIARSTNDGIWDWDLVTGEVFYSERWMELVGYGADEMPGSIETLESLMHPGDWKAVSSAIECYLYGRAESYTVEFRLRHRDGTWVWIQSRGIAVWDRAGRAVRFAGTHTDISARKREEERLEALVAERTAALRATNAELRRARDKAEIAAVAKTKFLAAASHDIRQPLQAMALLLDVLSDHVQPSGATLLSGVGTSLAEARDLLDSLLEYSRLDSGALRSDPRVVEIGDLVRNAVAGFDEEARRAGLDLRVHVRAATALTDPQMLRRIVRNLVSNALRHTEQGGVLVAVRPRHGRVVVEVWDSGVGIDPADRRRIFAEFYQGAARSARGGGLGLGLTIVDGLARLLGHDIGVDSRPGRGSRFAVWLSPAEPQRSEPDTADERGTPILFDGVVVAVVENDQAVRDALTAALGSWGCRPLVAEGSRDLAAAVAASGHVPHLIIADGHLDDEDGFDVLDEARARWPESPPRGVLLTGDTRHEALARRNRAGYRILHKPVPSDVLRSVLAFELREHRHTQGAPVTSGARVLPSGAPAEPGCAPPEPA
jgi:PAS domain S-box-containing protein